MSIEQSALSQTIASTATLKLARLHALDSFYTPMEERFERITRLAKRALGVPIAAITVVEGQRQWFKSVLGWRVLELPMSRSLCERVVQTSTQVIVNNTLHDTDFAEHPLVVGKEKFRFYAGYPLKDSNGNTVGTLCAFAFQPRTSGRRFRQALEDLGKLAERELFTMELANAQAALVTKLSESRRQAMFDPLTRLWNRRGGLKLLNTALKDSVAKDFCLGICLADVDNFKRINDDFGHRVGDEVLRRLARLIVAAVRPTDIVCRYGGEEFLIILRDVDELTCLDIGARICECIRTSPIRTSQGTLSASISVGIAMRKSSDPISSTQLIENADKALYSSKHAGRDRVSIESRPA